MSIFEALKSDHDKLKPLLEKLVAASEHDDATKALLDEIHNELVPHSRAEEAVLYNTLRSISITKDTVAHSYREHMEAEALLRTLRGLEKINVQWTAAAKKLRDGLLEHIAKEEGQVFAEAREVLSQEEVAQLGNAYLQVKAQARQQGDLKNTIDMIANALPKSIGDRIRFAGAPES